MAYSTQSWVSGLGGGSVAHNFDVWLPPIAIIFRRALYHHQRGIKFQHGWRASAGKLTVFTVFRLQPLMPLIR